MGMNFSPAPKPSFNRRVKKRGDRSKFSKMVRDAVKEKYNNQCAECGGKGLHLHHVTFRSQGGRGVISNALLLCNQCHKYIHLNEERALYWRDAFKKEYGPLYFMDKEDLEYKYLIQELHQEDKEVKEWIKHNDKACYNSQWDDLRR